VRQKPLRDGEKKSLVFYPLQERPRRVQKQIILDSYTWTAKTNRREVFFMKFSYSVLALLMVLSTACGTYEYRNRPDNSEVAVIRNIQNVFPVFASEFTATLDSLQIPEGPSLGHAEIREKIVNLYEQKDQLNAQLRDFVVARYQSYINAELDPSDQARERGRASWNEVTEKIHSAALEIRRIKESLQEAVRQNAEAQTKAKKYKEKKLKSKIELKQAGKEIHVLAGSTTEIQDPKVAKIVLVAGTELEEAIEKDEIPKAKAEAKKISSAISETGGKKALQLGEKLEFSLDEYARVIKELREQEINVDQTKSLFIHTLDQARDTLAKISDTLVGKGQ